MSYAFLCDDLRFYKLFTPQDYADGVSFAFDMLSENREVRIVVATGIPEGYMEYSQ